MGSNPSDVEMAHCIEDSETTIEIKIKTLDSQTYNLRVNKRAQNTPHMESSDARGIGTIDLSVPVPLLKEKIATITGILSEQQRLICRGKVLKDDELLSAYHVEDGHTLHLVARQPGQSTTAGNTGSEATTSNSTRHQGPTVARSIVLEAVNVEQGSSEFSSLGQILSSLLGSIGMPPNISAQVSGGPAPPDTGSSGLTQSSSVPAALRVELDSQQAPLHFQSEAALGSSLPNVIPDSLTTITQYLDFMRESFRRHGLNTNGRTEGSVDHGTRSIHVGGAQNQDGQSASGQHGLPTAALLAEAMNSTRQLLVEEAAECLSQLSMQLGDLANVDSATRRNLQRGAMSSGVLLQHVGSLLLELGRTTMMLRIGQAPSEAVVNAGPAVFISPSGPNPLMVTPVPFFSGTRSVQLGPTFSGLGLQGSPLHPRDIDIQVRPSGAAPVASTNPTEVAGAQAQERTDRTENASHANVSEAFAGVMGAAPFVVESGVRVLPLRTVVAVPAGVTRSSSGPSSGGVGLIYPVVTRVQQRANVSTSDARNNQSPNEAARSGIHANQQPILQSSSQAHEAGPLGPIDANTEDSSQTPPGQQDGQSPLSQLLNRLQWIGSLFSGEHVRASGSNQQESMARFPAEQVDARNAGTPEASGVGTAVGQSVPADCGSTPLQAGAESSNSTRDGSNESSGSHQHCRDPLEGPNSKRQRRS